MIALLLLQVVALAAEPSAEVSDDGRVVGRVVVPVPAPAVRAAVEDPMVGGELSPEVLSVEVLEEETSGCTVLDTSTRGLLRPLTYRSRRCRTDEGWRDDLIESDDFTAYASEWSLREVEDGTEVTISVTTELNLPVPRGMVEKRQRKTVIQVLENLVDKVTPDKR